MRYSILVFLACLLGLPAQVRAQQSLWAIVAALDRQADVERGAVACEILVGTLLGDIDFGWEPPPNTPDRLGEAQGIGSAGWQEGERIKMRKDLDDRLLQLLGEISACAEMDIKLSIVKHELVHVGQEVPQGTTAAQIECEAYSKQLEFLCSTLADLDC